MPARSQPSICTFSFGLSSPLFKVIYFIIAFFNLFDQSSSSSSLSLTLSQLSLSVSSTPHSSMATTDGESNSASNPTYPEMILTAISALGEKEGSNKSAIIKYIEATYADTLREGYTAAISETLTDLKKSGKLLFENNLYIKPNPNSQPRRGRGRPKKPKPTLPPGSLPPTPRPRGRPPKPKDSQSNAVKAVGGIPRRRGRPPKPKNSQTNAVKVKIPGRRGRPPKSNVTKAGAVKAAGGTLRRRGRPPTRNQAVVSEASKGDGTAPAVSGVKRRRGRPSKVKLAAAQ